MIRLPTLDVLSPTTLHDLVETLRASNGETKILAGGTDLIVNLKQGMHAPRQLVWLGKVHELRRISRSTDGSLRIGATCTLSEIAASVEVRRLYPSLADAVQTIASPAIRNSATLGGNLCLDTRCFYYNESEFWRVGLGGCLKLLIPARDNGDVCHAAPGRTTCSAVFSSDTSPLLIALGASVRIIRAGGERFLSLSSFYNDDGMHFLTLKPGEVLAEVILPQPSPHLRAVHRKIRQRASIDFPLANVGIALTSASNGVCQDVRIVLGAVASAPFRATAAETVLEGNTPTDERIEQASTAAASCVSPLPNIGSTVRYRKRMVKVLVKRALADIMSVLW